MSTKIQKSLAFDLELNRNENTSLDVVVREYFVAPKK